MNTPHQITSREGCYSGWLTRFAKCLPLVTIGLLKIWVNTFSYSSVSFASVGHMLVLPKIILEEKVFSDCFVESSLPSWSYQPPGSSCLDWKRLVYIANPRSLPGVTSIFLLDVLHYTHRAAVLPSVIRAMRSALCHFLFNSVSYIDDPCPIYAVIF